MKLHVQQLLNIPIERIASIEKRYDIVLDDNTIIESMNPAELHTSLYFWSILKRFKTPITKEMILSNYYKNSYYSKSTLNSLLGVIKERILKDTLIPRYLNTDGNYIRLELDKLHLDMLMTTNNIYNGLIFNRLEYMSTLHIKHFLEVQNHPKLIEAMEEVEKHKGVFYIEQAYNVIDKLMFSKEFASNPIARGYQAGLLNKNQVFKVFGPGGFVTELNNKIFKIPITSSFTMGLKDMYEISIESRNAAKALAVTNKAIADSEAFARLLQLTTTVVQGITVTDCGNDDYEDFYVKPATDGYQGDLPNLIGKYRYDEVTKKEVIITKKDEHLIGTNIKLRTIQNCRLENKYNVCYKCFGELTWSIPTHFNIGHLSATVLTQVLTQSLLSLKHLIVSASSRNIYLPDKIKKTIRSKNNKFYINKSVLSKGGDITLHVKQEEAVGFMILVNKITERLEKIDKLTDMINNRDGDTELLSKELEVLKDITEESIDSDKAKITWLNDIKIKQVINNAKGKQITEMVFNIKKTTKNMGHLSIPFLIWVILNKKYTLDEDNNYVIDISSYPSNKSFMELPDREYDFTQLIDEVKRLVRSSEDDKDAYGPNTLLNKLFQTVNEKVSTNIAILEIIVYALTVPATTGNYDLSRNATTKRVASLSTISKHRSFTLGGNDVRRLIFSQLPYSEANKPHNPADILLKANEVLKDIKDGSRNSNHRHY